MITGVNRTTRTACFAPTTDTDTSARNMTRVSEHLHEFLEPEVIR